jgi:hypothetical protein
MFYFSGIVNGKYLKRSKAADAIHISGQGTSDYAV